MSNDFLVTLTKMSFVSLKYPYFTFLSQSDTLLGFIRKYVNHCPADLQCSEIKLNIFYNCTPTPTHNIILPLISLVLTDCILAVFCWWWRVLSWCWSVGCIDRVEYVECLEWHTLGHLHITTAISLSSTITTQHTSSLSRDSSLFLSALKKI